MSAWTATLTISSKCMIPASLILKSWGLLRACWSFRYITVSLHLSIFASLSSTLSLLSSLPSHVKIIDTLTTDIKGIFVSINLKLARIVPLHLLYKVLCLTIISWERTFLLSCLSPSIRRIPWRFRWFIFFTDNASNGRVKDLRNCRVCLSFFLEEKVPDWDLSRWRERIIRCSVDCPREKWIDKDVRRGTEASEDQQEGNSRSFADRWSWIDVFLLRCIESSVRVTHSPSTELDGEVSLFGRHTASTTEIHLRATTTVLISVSLEIALLPNTELNIRLTISIHNPNWNSSDPRLLLLHSLRAQCSDWEERSPRRSRHTSVSISWYCSSCSKKNFKVCSLERRSFNSWMYSLDERELLFLSEMNDNERKMAHSVDVIHCNSYVWEPMN